MQRLLKLYRTTIGKKAVMAVTGVLLVLYVIAHMVGNLKIYWGPGHDGHEAKIDIYGHFLRTVGEGALGYEGVLWIARVVLLAAVVLHVLSAIQVWRTSHGARPVGYRKQDFAAANYASRTMRWGGLLLAAFVVYHILHFTTGQAHSAFVHGQVYQNVVVGFQNPLVSLVYIVAMLFLGLHLYHGVWSGLQTLGVSNPRYNGWQRGLAATIAIVVAGGNISIPAAVLTGIVH
jgi:succinate dehydrogenase / fumarate reductase cytochrome b subunit